MRYEQKAEVQDSNKARLYEKKYKKKKKYNYTYDEHSVDVRYFEVESEVMLTEREVQDIALGCDLKDGYTYQGGEKGKRYKAKFIGTEYGDDCQDQFGGDKYKETNE